MKILIVSPFFPPHKSVAIVRVSSLIRYLLTKKIDITVLTNKTDSTDDEEFLKKITRVEVDISSAKNKYFPTSLLYKKAFLQLMDKETFDVVLITVGPYYTLPLCKISKKIYNTRCVVDFRDLWILDVRSLKQFFKPENILKKMLFYPIEVSVMKHAVAVVTVTEGWAKLLKIFHPFYRNKVNVIANGFDDYCLVKDISVNQKEFTENNIENFNIVTFGKLSYYSIEYTTIFLKDLKKIMEKYPFVKLIQIGDKEEQIDNIMDEIAFPKEKFSYTGFCDYNEGMRLLSSSNISVIIDIRKHAVGTKIYDYIFVNSPILYVGKKRTYLSEFVSSFDNGFSTHKETEVFQAISTVIEHRIRKLTSNDNNDKYSRRLQNEKYLSLLKSVIDLNF